MTNTTSPTDRIGRRARVPAQIEAWLAAVVVACSVGSLAYVAKTHPTPTNRVGRFMTVYTEVAAELPPVPRVGFVPSAVDRSPVSVARFIAQNALAPRVIDSDLAAVSFVITNPDAPASYDSDPLLADFELLRISKGGIRIYRRRE